jgi:uncharacterized membrane protein
MEETLMSNHTVVIAIFDDEASADVAVISLKNSGVARGDAIGVLVLDENGELKEEKAGRSSWGKGAGIGAVVALATPVGLVAGLIAGGLLGALHHKDLGLSDADRERIRSELEDGKAAVGVLAPVSEATIVAEKLTELGGTSETHPVSDEAVEEAQKAAAGEQASTHSPSYDEISERAYLISLEDGGEDEVENWLRAERELTQV